MVTCIQIDFKTIWKGKKAAGICNVKMKILKARNETIIHRVQRYCLACDSSEWKSGLVVGRFKVVGIYTALDIFS